MAEVFVLTWGDLDRHCGRVQATERRAQQMRWVTGREVSRGHSTEKREPGGWILRPFKLAKPVSTIRKGPNQHRGADLRTLSKLQPPQGAMRVENRTQAETASSRGYTLVDVLDPDNLARAWKQVKANRGAAGIDGMEVGEFPAFMREHWERLRGKLEDGTYKPSPVRRVDIPKDGGGTRPLGIPTVLDRLIQQAIAQVLTPDLRPNLQPALARVPPDAERSRGHQ